MKKILLIPLLLILTGCYNYRELNDLAIVSGASISMEDNEYRVTLEIVNPKKQQNSSGANDTEFVIYSAKDKSIQKAFRKVINESPKKAYGAQMDILIIDHTICTNGLKEILDFLARDPEIRSEFYILISKNNEILEVTTPLDKISSQNILNSLKTNEEYLGTTNLVTYHDLLSNYLNDKIELALPSIETKGNTEEGEKLENTEQTEPSSSPSLSTIAVFKDNKLIGYLEEEESITYNFIMGNIKTTLIKTDYDNNQFIVNEIISTKTKLDVVPKDNKITINISGTSSLSEVNYNCNLESSDTINQIEKDLNNQIEKMIKENTYNIISKYNSDIFGFRDLYYKKDPKYYKKIKDDWYEKYFNNINIEVKSDINIFEKGNLNGGLYNE